MALIAIFFMLCFLAEDSRIAAMVVPYTRGGARGVLARRSWSRVDVGHVQGECNFHSLQCQGELNENQRGPRCRDGASVYASLCPRSPDVRLPGNRWSGPVSPIQIRGFTGEDCGLHDPTAEKTELEGAAASHVIATSLVAQTFPGNFPHLPKPFPVRGALPSFPAAPSPAPRSALPSFPAAPSPASLRAPSPASLRRPPQLPAAPSPASSPSFLRRPPQLPCGALPNFPAAPSPASLRRPPSFPARASPASLRRPPQLPCGALPSFPAAPSHFPRRPSLRRPPPCGALPSFPAAAPDVKRARQG
nr:proline-rich receptor-like protein kinase PERK10 [Penaeus vannamei]